MATSTLVNHCGAREVPFEELATMPIPSATATWFPIPRHQVFQSVVDALQGADFGIRQSRLSLARDDAQFFGALDLTTLVSDGRTRQKASPAEAAMSTIRLQKLLSPPLTLDAEVSPSTDFHSSERGMELPVLAAQ